MSRDFFDALVRLRPAGNPNQPDGIARNPHVLATLADEGRPHSEPLTPELLEWAKGLFTDEEVIAGMTEIRETGGLELKDFIAELEQEARPRE